VRGRATRVVLPALVVLGLVALVAIASTGATQSGSGQTRQPSESLLDALFTLGLVAVFAGGVLLLYGLTQRQAIAREAARGRIPRFGLLSTLALLGVFTAVTYWRFGKWKPPAPTDEEGDFAFPGLAPVPTTPDREQPSPYEPSVSWLPIALVAGLVLAGIVTYVISERRANRGRRSGEALAEQLAHVLDETLDDLRAEADPRRAIIAAYARLERVLAANGVARRAAETSDEYLPRVLDDLALDPRAVERLTLLFTRAKFSQHDVDTAMKEEAIGALEDVRDELRLARERPQPEPEPMPVGARP